MRYRFVHLTECRRSSLCLQKREPAKETRIFINIRLKKNAKNITNTYNNYGNYINKITQDNSDIHKNAQKEHRCMISQVRRTHRCTI